MRIDNPNLVFLDRATFAAHLEFTRPDIACQWHEYPNTSPAEVIQRLHDADIAIVNKVGLTAQTLRKLPRLAMISLVATGFDNLDLDYCREAGIAVTNARNYATNSLAEHAFGLMLALARSTHRYHESVTAGRWCRSQEFCYFDYPIRDLHDRTLCIIGTGNLGSQVARIAQAFGMQVISSGRKGQAQATADRVPFAQAIAKADIISLHCPLNRQTANLLGTEEFAMMEQHPLIINTARGGLIDPQALVAALETGQIAGAAVDVLPTEPPAVNDILIEASARMSNLIITPHIAWGSDQSQHACWKQAMDNILAWLQGKALRRLV